MFNHVWCPLCSHSWGCRVIKHRGTYVRPMVDVHYKYSRYIECVMSSMFDHVWYPLHSYSRNFGGIEHEQAYVWPMLSTYLVPGQIWYDIQLASMGVHSMATIPEKLNIGCQAWLSIGWTYVFPCLTPPKLLEWLCMDIEHRFNMFEIHQCLVE